jgi:hypothetical protein
MESWGGAVRRRLPRRLTLCAPINADQRPKTRLAELIGVDAGDA